MYSAAVLPYLLRALQDNPAFGQQAAVALWLSSIANPLMEVALRLGPLHDSL